MYFLTKRGSISPRKKTKLGGVQWGFGKIPDFPPFFSAPEENTLFYDFLQIKVYNFSNIPSPSWKRELEQRRLMMVVAKDVSGFKTFKWQKTEEKKSLKLLVRINFEKQKNKLDLYKQIRFSI